ncbi:MAG: glycosyltransferase family 39 protein [Afipia sp.]|nr:glycosyltransferase family 39 protein [Afipia sp.]
MTNTGRIDGSPSTHRSVDRGTVAVAAGVAVLVVLQIVYAATADLRTDEAYYWTWSKENVLSFLDHPPMIAWLVRFGTAIFGDTNFGARFGCVLAMWIAQGLIADIVWRQTRDRVAVALAILMPQAALEYGMFGSRVVPDAAMIPFALAMVWALVRLTESNDGRWWLLAGAFGGLALLSKFTVVLLVPAIIAFALVPPWRGRWLRSVYPLGAMLIAAAIFSPVLYWNWLNDWAGFRFQFVRVGADHGVSARTVLDFVGLQLGLVGLLLFPVALGGSLMLAWRGYRTANPAFILLSTCAIAPFAFFLWRSLSLRVGDTWPLVIWPFAFAAAAINLAQIRRLPQTNWFLRTAQSWAIAAIAIGVMLNAGAFYFYGVSQAQGLGSRDPIGKEEGYREIAMRAKADAERNGATWIATVNYRIYAMLRWHLKDSFPVVQVTERSRFLGFDDTKAKAAIRSGDGLYIDTTPNDRNIFEALTPAVVQQVDETERMWRGVKIETFVFKTIRNWKPDLNPPPDTLFYNWQPLG